MMMPREIVADAAVMDAVRRQVRLVCQDMPTMDREDAQQEAVMAILEWGKPVDNPTAWAVTVARNAALKFRRKDAKYRDTEIPVGLDPYNPIT